MVAEVEPKLGFGVITHICIIVQIQMNTYNWSSSQWARPPSWREPSSARGSSSRPTPSWPARAPGASPCSCGSWVHNCHVTSLVTCDVMSRVTSRPSWQVSGLIALAGALCWAELATVFPRQGGTYIFIKEGLGDLPAFVYIYMRSVLSIISDLIWSMFISRVFLLNPVAGAVQSIAAAQYLLGRSHV